MKPIGAIILQTAVLAIICTSCASRPVHTETKAAPSADVGKLQAWYDANMIANRAQGRSTAVGTGTSMLPVYGDNTMLVINAVAYDELRLGMNVAYRNARGVEVVHRLVKKLPKGWRVAGLNNEEVDEELVTPQNLIGVVYATINYDDD